MSARGKCVHFNGMQNTCCNAGVNYRQAFGRNRETHREPCISEWKSHERVDGKMVPIWKPWGRPEQQVIPCDKFRLPTAEEIAADEAEFQRSLDRMRTVMAVVSKWRTWSRKNRVAKQEAIDCPTKCGGKLHLSQAALNGHVWGRCTTPDCVSWME
jgi:hypothetical protein